MTIAILQVTHSLHPLAGATALIAVLGPVQVHRLGYLFILTPLLTGFLILLAVAVIVNTLSEHSNRHYPHCVVVMDGLTTTSGGCPGARGRWDGSSRD